MRRSHPILVALLAAAAITAIDSHFSLPGATASAPPAKSEARVSDATAAASPVSWPAIASDTKADMLDGGRPCARQVWPYIASHCLASVDGAPASRVSRMITVEHRRATGSDLARVAPVRLVGR